MFCMAIRRQQLCQIAAIGLSLGVLVVAASAAPNHFRYVSNELPGSVLFPIVGESCETPARFVNIFRFLAKQVDIADSSPKKQLGTVIYRGYLLRRYLGEDGVRAKPSASCSSPGPTMGLCMRTSRSSP